MKKLYDFIKTNYFYFIVYSIIGWIYELFFFLVVDGNLINRGFLMGPYLPIYGIGALFIVHLLSKLKNKKIYIKKFNIMPVIIFILIFIITTVVEYIGHFILDECFNIILWDYSQDFLNINGRVCLYASRNFAIMGIIGIYFMQPKLDNIINKMNKVLSDWLFIFLMIVFVFDLIFTILKL